jgi:hypothetical protein
MTTAVKDWHKFQHYKCRNPPWIKLHKSLLDDPDWHALDPALAKVLAMIWLIASENHGQLPELRKLAFRLRMTEKQCASTLNALSHWLVQDASAPLADCAQDACRELEEEEEIDKEEEKKEVRADARRAKGTRLPLDWQPDDVAKQYALSFGVPLEAETEKFRDYWHARAGPGAVKVDWSAAWRNWCRKSREFNGNGANGKAQTRLGAAVERLRVDIDEATRSQEMRRDTLRLIQDG